jgi:hypothetical protein
MKPETRAAEAGGPWNEPLVFWRESGGRRTGLACLASFCDNPDCTCQEAHLQAIEVDERFVKLSVQNDHVQVLADDGGGPMPKGNAFVVVDLESGRLTRVEHVRPRKRQSELLRWLEEAIDDAVLDDLRDRWRSYKAALKGPAGPGAAEGWRDQDWTWWDGEEAVGWHDVHPEAAEDRYRFGGATHEAADYYYVLPDCDFEEITVRFFRVVGENRDVVGEVFVDPGSSEVVGTTNAPGERRRLDRLWSAYEASRDLSELSRRFREMRRLGPAILAERERQLRPAAGRGGEPEHGGTTFHSSAIATVRGSAKVGRNEPCPCGSGQKYKKCCGRRA